ncbi:MAG: serine/threonine-protein kinase [Verrucomicrobiota bacterium]
MTSAVPPELRARFEVVEALSVAPRAAVFRAVERTTGHVCGLKFYPAEASPGKDELHAAVERSQAIRSPSLVAYREVIAYAGGAALVWGYRPGRNLEQAGPAESAGRLTACARELLEALEALHQAGWCHGDVSPANVLLEDALDPPAGGVTGHAVLLDWLPLPWQTRGRLFGTIHTLAPERLEGAPPSPAGDLYGLGASLYYALAGRHAFTGESEAEIAARHLSGDYEPLASAVPARPREAAPGLAALVERCLARRAEDRPASAREAIAFLAK